MSMFEHQDALAALDGKFPLSEKLALLQQLLQERFDFIDRVAVAVYDRQTDRLKTFLHSSGGDQPLNHYEARLSDSRSLMEIVRQRRPRVVNDLSIFDQAGKTHSDRIKEQGYGASYTLPMYANGDFFGFIFVNSYRRHCFSEAVLRELDPFLHLLSSLTANEYQTAQTLAATVRTALDLAHHRDPETGSHLERMARYARLIAMELARKRGLSDEFIENLFLFAPLHDIGKLAIPDEILLKPGRLTAEEFRRMQEHTTRGREIVDRILANFQLDGFPHVELLRNVVEAHHEALDGSGYPKGLSEEQIPVEARIAAVADIFDALTSARPYKEAWSNDKAFQILTEMAQEKLDIDCVQALIDNRELVELIQAQFGEDLYG